MTKCSITGAWTAAVLLLGATVSAQPAQPPSGAAPPGAAAAGGIDKDRALPAELIETRPDGLTAEKVAERAAATSYAAQAASEGVRAAAARVDAAWSAFLPRIALSGRYTRLSEFTPGTFGFGSGSLVVTGAPNGTINPTPTQAQTVSLGFPVIFNNWNFQASLMVPISDYFLRINQTYSAATASRDAARQDAAGARAKSASDGKVAYYTWLRARGGHVVAIQALDDQKTHLTDAKNLFTVGRVSKVDVLRAETAVAAAELAVERTKNFVDIAERQIRIAMHATDDEVVVAGEGLQGATPPFPGNLAQLTQEAMSGRTEIRSIDLSAQALRKNAEATRNGAFPQFAGVANTNLVNPNQRAFPQKDEFFPTWDLTLQLQWSPNDILGAGGQAAALYAQAAQVEAQRQAVRDGITLEVAQAYNAVKEAEFAIDASKRELEAAREAHRVAHELFINGAATSTTLTDAETELTRARLDALNAAVDVRSSRVRLEHALGRDVKASP